MPQVVDYERAVIVGTNPAANTEWSQTVPAGTWWEVISVGISLLQGATQTPQPVLVMDKGLTTDHSLGTFTVTLASPGVFTRVAHGLVEGDLVHLKTTGALPTGLAVDTIYYIITAGLTVDAFQVALTKGGAAINTSVSQSGVHTLYNSPIIYEGFGSTNAQAASTTCRYTWGLGLSNSAVVGTTTNVHATATLPAGTIVGPGFRIRSFTVGIGANSDYGAPLFQVKRLNAQP
jgi:hypothetical protein